jgi:hypothetical protein
MILLSHKIGKMSPCSPLLSIFGRNSSGHCSCFMSINKSGAPISCKARFFPRASTRDPRNKPAEVRREPLRSTRHPPVRQQERGAEISVPEKRPRASKVSTRRPQMAERWLHWQGRGCTEQQRSIIRGTGKLITVLATMLTSFSILT